MELRLPLEKLVRVRGVVAEWLGRMVGQKGRTKERNQITAQAPTICGKGGHTREEVYKKDHPGHVVGAG